MIFWITLLLIAALVVGTIHQSASARDERNIKLRRIQKRLAEKEAEEKKKKEEIK